MRLLRLQFVAAILIVSLTAVCTLSATAAAPKKKSTSTKSSKTRETSGSKSAKSKKVQPQAKNSRPRRTQSTTSNRQVASSSRSSGQPAEITSTRKGKKGFAASSPTPAEIPAARTTSTLNVPKPTPVVAPITAPAVNQATSSTLLKTESSAPLRPASEAVQSSVPLTIPLPSNQPDRLEVIEYRDAQKNSAGPRSPPPSQTRGFGISNRRIDVEIDTPRVIQIQKALKDRGFYSLEPTGIYDDDTINAMKAFQGSERIDITGYPTAHALKRLGL